VVASGNADVGQGGSMRLEAGGLHTTYRDEVGGTSCDRQPIEVVAGDVEDAGDGRCGGHQSTSTSSMPRYLDGEGEGA
jgi:hypothetical protein